MHRDTGEKPRESKISCLGEVGHEVAGVYADKEQAEAKAKAFNFQRI